MCIILFSEEQEIYKFTWINLSDAVIKHQNKIHNVIMKEVILGNVIIKRGVMRQCNDKKRVLWGNVIIKRSGMRQCYNKKDRVVWSSVYNKKKWYEAIL